MKCFLKRALAVGLTAATLCTSLAGCRKKDDGSVSDTTPIPTPAIESTPEPSANPNIYGDVDTSGGNKIQNGKLVLTKIEPAEPNNCASNGYMEEKNLDGTYRYQVKAETVAAKNLVPYTDANGAGLKIFSGHTVYVRKTGLGVGEMPETTADDSSSTEEIITDTTTSTDTSSGYIDENGNYVEDATDSNGTTTSSTLSDTDQKCIVSGEEIFDLDNYSDEIQYPSDFSQLRKEETCERLYVYHSKEEYEQALKNRKNGQAILTGEMDAPIKSVILNGSLIPKLNYTINSDGRLCVSLRALAEAYDSNTQYDDVEHLLIVPITYGERIYIPVKGILHNASEYYQIDNTNNTFVFTSKKPPEIWTDTFSLATTSDVVMPVEDISRILGWDFWYGDNVLSVVTDSLDDTKEENILLQEQDVEEIEIDLNDLPDVDSTESDSESEVSVS